MLMVTPEIGIDEGEIEELFVRASGPGGQNVNKVATAVQLRFDVRHSKSLPDDVRERLMQSARNRISADGVLTIDARRFRTQEQNREDARQRLAALVEKALHAPSKRHATKPSKAAKERRLESKRRTSRTKQMRRDGARDEG